MNISAHLHVKGNCREACRLYAKPLEALGGADRRSAA
jgi:hypothetical protein